MGLLYYFFDFFPNPQVSISKSLNVFPFLSKIYSCKKQTYGYKNTFISKTR